MSKKYFLFLTALLSLTFFAGAVEAQTGGVNSPNQASEEKIYKADEVDQKAEITNRRRVKISSECGTEKNSSGQVKLELVLHKSGKVTSVKLAEKSGCRYFNDRSLEIAKKIKFKSAMKDGKTVSQYAYIIYEYSFYIVN